MKDLERDLVATKRKVARAMMEYVAMLERHEISGRIVEEDLMTIYKKREAVSRMRVIK